MTETILIIVITSIVILTVYTYAFAKGEETKRK